MRAASELASLWGRWMAPEMYAGGLAGRLANLGLSAPRTGDEKGKPAAVSWLGGGCGTAQAEVSIMAGTSKSAQAEEFPGGHMTIFMTCASWPRLVNAASAIAAHRTSLHTNAARLSLP